MASKRIATSTVDWAAFLKRVPKDQIAQFNVFKAKSDSYTRAVQALPDALPKINWENYQGKIAVAGMVDEFKKQYEAVKVPYPAENYVAKITAMEKEEMARVKEFIADSEKRIAEHQVEVARWDAIPAFDNMTHEQFVEHFPDQAVNWKKPEFWPFTPESQPGYVDEEVKEEAH